MGELDDRAWELLRDDIREIKEGQRELRQEVKDLRSFKVSLVAGGTVFVSIISMVVTIAVNLFTGYKDH